MSGQYAANEGNERINGNKINSGLNYIILKDLFLRYGADIFREENEPGILTIILNHTYRDEDKEKARKTGGEIFLSAMYSAKLAVALRAVMPVLKCTFDGIIHDSRNNGKSIEEILDEKIKKCCNGNIQKSWNPKNIEEKIKVK